MKRYLLLIVLLCATVSIVAQKKFTFMLTGASFAVKENGWFELGCEAFEAQPLNKSVSGQAILQTASGMFDGTFYSKAELEETDVFIIMHVHNQPVSKTDWIKEDYTQYTKDAISTNYAIAYDYVIKKYKDDCYKLKDDPTSKYYNTENGKPALIMLCTHWHDSRTIYNPAIRELAQRWGFPLIKWDDKIGFSRNDVAAGEEQPSRKVSGDTENIGGIIYGWHPLRGQGQPIQQKMASIFIEEMQNILGEIPVTAHVKAKNDIITEGEEAYASFSFTGVSPWSLTYEVNGQPFKVDNIELSPLLVKLDVAKGEKTVVIPKEVSNATSQGTVSGEAVITYADGSLPPFFDTYVHNANQSTTYMSDTKLELKTSSDNYSRQAFISFDISNLTETDSMMILRLFFRDLIYSVTNPPIETHVIEVAGNTKTYTSITWSNKPSDFTSISETSVAASEKGSFISWDVSDWVKEQKDAGAEKVTFLLKVKSGGTGLFNFPSSESTDDVAQKPTLLTIKKIATGIETENIENAVEISSDYIAVNTPLKKLSIYNISGTSILEAHSLTNETISTDLLQAGVYILNYETSNGSKSEKFIKR